MNELSNIVKFYRDCYQTDLKGIRIRNFTSKQCEKRYIPNNNELFLENYLGLPIESKWAKEVEQILYLDSKEKALYGGTVFISGIQNTLGRKNVAFTPMYIHEFDLEHKENVYFLSLKETYFNPDFLELANSIDPTLNLDLEHLSEFAPADPFGFGNLVLLQNFLNKYFKTWNSESLSNYQLQSFDYKKYYNKLKPIKKNTKEIFSCLMFGVFKKPSGSLGVLTELNQLSKKAIDSKLLNLLFRFEEFKIKNLKKRDIFLPTTLSENQESAIYSSDAYPVTQIIGPPGTGKSYTISALAIDAISNNKSVLVVTRNVQASRVIVNIIENQFGLKGSSIKAYNQVYKKSLIAKLSKATSFKTKQPLNPSDQRKKIRKIISAIEQIEDQIIDVGHREYEWGNFYSENPDNFLSIFKDKWYKYRKRSTEPIWRLNEELKTLRERKTKLVRKYIKAKIKYDLETTVSERKMDFVKLNLALKESNLTQLDKKIRKIDFELILKAIPLWASTTKEISKCLPLVKEMFDLVIFDESSQCDLASSIPSMYRAKELIVVGDPHQLRHISFLSQKKQNELKENYSVTAKVANYRKESLIDWTNFILSNPDQTTYLNEHFRSKTDIIQYSNSKFYNNELKLIRSIPLPDDFNTLEVYFKNGKRDAKGINLVEVESILNKVESIIEAYENSNELALPTIGISSPFTEQVKKLKKSIAQVIPFDRLKRHNVLIGTPFHFQGEERDIMLISFCVDNSTSMGAFNYLNRSDVFNVLVTRAKNQQFVYTSLKPSEMPSKSLLKEYIETCNFQIKNEGQNIIYDSFYAEVKEFLSETGIEIIKQATLVSGVLIDLVIIQNNKYVCIDLIGFPGEFEDQFSLEDIRILNRVQAPIFFLPYSSWYIEQEKTKKNLINFIKTATKD